jgi:hypothetical protein
MNTPSVGPSVLVEDAASATEKSFVEIAEQYYESRIEYDEFHKKSVDVSFKTKREQRTKLAEKCTSLLNDLIKFPEWKNQEMMVKLNIPRMERCELEQWLDNIKKTK